MESVKIATKIKAVRSVRVVCDPPSHLERNLWGTDADGKFGRLSYGTKEYWDKLREVYQEWVNELEEFFRDHRSRDSTGLSVETDMHDVCSCCGGEWEIDNSYDDGKLHCAGCGAEIEKE